MLIWQPLLFLLPCRYLLDSMAFLVARGVGMGKPSITELHVQQPHRG
jgi:hypothetical protein